MFNRWAPNHCRDHGDSSYDATHEPVQIIPITEDMAANGLNRQHIEGSQHGNTRTKNAINVHVNFLVNTVTNCINIRQSNEICMYSYMKINYKA